MAILSIIVPVYNVQEYLERCVDSILGQTLIDIEVILIDDGSTDQGGEICDLYSSIDNRVIVIHNQNGGLSYARNEGLKIATGKYIAFVDSDDYISQNMFNTLVGLAEDKNADIVECRYSQFYHEIEIESQNIILNPQVTEFTGQNALYNYLLPIDDSNRKIFTVVWDKIYRKELFENIMFPEGKIYEDGYVTYKLLYRANKVIHVNQVLYYYFQREQSITHSKYPLVALKSYDDWKEIFDFISVYANHLSYLAGEKYIKKHITIYNTVGLYTDDVDTIMAYKNKIVDDLKKDYKMLIKLKIKFKTKLLLSVFIASKLVDIW